MMRVLHVCDTIIGGTGSYLAELIPHQIARFGRDNVILIMPRQHLSYVDPVLTTAGLRIEPFERPSRLVGLIPLALRFLSVNRAFKPDIVHAHSSSAGFMLRILRFAYKAKLVFCSHGWAFDMAGNAAKRWSIQTIERLLSIFADRIIAISTHEYKRALQIGISRDRLVLIHNGLGRHAPPLQAAPWDDPRMKIVFAGRIDRQKGLDLLLTAVETMGERVAVRVIGRPVVEQSNPISTTLPFVEFLGWRDRTEVAAHMMSADLLVVPSRWEGFGLIALEAMRLSLPVAAASVGGLQDIIEGGRYGFAFRPDDAQALRACLEAITREDLARMREAGYRRFIDCFTAERMVVEIDRLYTELLGAEGIHEHKGLD